MTVGGRDGSWLLVDVVEERAAWEFDTSIAHQILVDEEAARKGLDLVGYVNCLGDSCATQMTPIFFSPALVTLQQPAPTGPPVVEATTTTTAYAAPPSGVSAAAVRTVGLDAAPSRQTQKSWGGVGID